jgi:hypothetical protein
MNKREKRFLRMIALGALLMTSQGWVYAGGHGNPTTAAKEAAGGPGRLFACFMTLVMTGTMDAGVCDPFLVDELPPGADPYGSTDSAVGSSWY